MKISLGGYSFNSLFLEGKMDVFGYLETVKYRYRLDAVDLWNAQIAERTTPLLTLADDSYLRKVREALDERELRLINLAVDTAHLWDPDPEMREALYQNALAHIKAAVLLGADSVRIDTGGYDEHDFSEEAFDWIVTKYREYCRICSDYGIKVGLENHMGPSLMPKQLARIAQAVDETNFGILVHLNRWDDDRERGNEIVAPWVIHTHFDYNTAASENASETVRMLRRYGYDGHWAIEYNPPSNPYIEIEHVISQVKKRLAESDT